MERDLFDVLDQSEGFVFVPPKLRRITPRRHQLAATVLLINNVAAQIAQRRFQHVEYKLGPGRAAGRAGAEIGPELMLMLGFGEIAQHFGRRSEKDESAALIEQNRLVKHLEKFRARLMDRDHDDLVVGHAPNDLDHVLGVFRRQTGSWLIEKINVRHPDHIEPDVEPFALAAAQRLFDGATNYSIPP